MRHICTLSHETLKRLALLKEEWVTERPKVNMKEELQAVAKATPVQNPVQLSLYEAIY